jgi:hypothetical protein
MNDLYNLVVYNNGVELFEIEGVEARNDLEAVENVKKTLKNIEYTSIEII